MWSTITIFILHRFFVGRHLLKFYVNQDLRCFREHTAGLLIFASKGYKEAEAAQEMLRMCPRVLKMDLMLGSLKHLELLLSNAFSKNRGRFGAQIAAPSRPLLFPVPLGLSAF